MTSLKGADLLAFLELAQDHVEHSLRANHRNDNLYHSYNILHLGENTASIGRLYEMLEGQVSILSSGMLNGDESLALLKSLRHSTLYRADQHTYILYPDKTLPNFLQKNSLTAEQVSNLRLLAILAEKRDKSLLIRDIEGVYHFSGNLRNGKDVRQVLEFLGSQPGYRELVESEGEQIVALFESIFRHAEFTGRSGTFFAYEGLGSVYWHMVSKLLLAVQETILRCQGEPAVHALLERYRDIRSGLSFNKSPAAYGAFPTDPYSHTPRGQGARQPGMTGLVKEEILTRQAEMGLMIENGCLIFNPLFVNRSELLSNPAKFTYMDVMGCQKHLELDPRSMAFLFCQTPIILQAGGKAEIQIIGTNGRVHSIPGHRLSESESRHIFQRDGVIQKLTVSF